MAQMLKGTIVFKTPCEYNVRSLHGDPYALIVEDPGSKKQRFYMLDTTDDLYYPIAEWDIGDSESFDHWHEYGLKLDDKIRKKRDESKQLQSSTDSLSKTEQFVPDEQKMIKDIEDDPWSVFSL